MQQSVPYRFEGYLLLPGIMVTSKPVQVRAMTVSVTVLQTGSGLSVARVSIEGHADSRGLGGHLVLC